VLLFSMLSLPTACSKQLQTNSMCIAGFCFTHAPNEQTQHCPHVTRTYSRHTFTPQLHTCNQSVSCNANVMGLHITKVPSVAPC
jgi:hypothetical protein